MTEEKLSSRIYSSRDKIRQEIINYLSDYLELENIDLTKSSFLSYLINVLSVLTSNLIFYCSATYKEFFLTKAVIPESIYNLSAFIGYHPKLATPSTGYVLVTVPLTFDDPDVTFIIERPRFEAGVVVEGHKLYAGDTIFSPLYTCVIRVLANSTVTVTASDEYRTFDFPVYVDSTANEFSFLLPVSQVEYKTNTFIVDSDIQIYQFYDVEVETTSQVSEVEVRVKYPGDTGYRLFTEYDSLFLMSPTTEGYVIRKTASGLRISFGNGLIGKRLEPSSEILIITKETLGAEGNVVSGSIKKIDDIYVQSAGVSKKVKILVENTSATTGGKDEESLTEIRTNAISSLTSLNRAVTESDYQHLEVILENCPLSHYFPVLKQSDLKQNDITIFSDTSFNGEMCPTRNAIWDLAPDDTSVQQYEIINIDGEDYYSLFDIDVDPVNEFAVYNYTVRSIEKTPILVESFKPEYRLSIDRFNAVRDSTGDVTIKFHYDDSQVNYGTYGDFYAKVTINGEEYVPVIKNVAQKTIEHKFLSNDDIPTGLVNIYVTVYSSVDDSEITRYEVDCILKRFLDDFMYSPAILLNLADTTTGTPLDMSSTVVTAHNSHPSHSPQNLVSGDYLYYMTDSTSPGAPGYVEFCFGHNLFVSSFQFRAINNAANNFHFKKFEVQYSPDNGITWITCPHTLYNYPSWIPIGSTEMPQVADGSMSPLVHFDRVFTNRMRVVWWSTTHPADLLCAMDEFFWYNVGQTVRRIYDVPVIRKDYFDSIDQTSFETTIIQTMIEALQFASVKMMTDFANIKLSNTTGKVHNFQLNKVTADPVIDIDLTSVPSSPNVGDRYIVTGKEGPPWTGHKGEIAECIDSTTPTWYFFEMPVNTIVWVQNKRQKYVNTVFGWLVPDLSIPLEIQIQVKKDPFSSIDQQTLVQNIKSNLLEYFTPMFGNEAEIYRSEIIKVVQQTEGVEYCKLDKPEVDIFFTYEIDELTQEQLLEYAPDLIYFTEDSIYIYFI